MTSVGRARLALIGAAVGWSLAGPFVKILHLDATVLVGWRSLFAGLVCLPFLVARRAGRVLRTTSGVTPDVLSVVGAGLAPARLLPLNRGGFALAGTYTCVVWLFVSATTATTAAAAIFLQYTAPAWVAVMAVLWLKEPLDRRTVASAGLAFLGIAAILVGEAGGRGGWRGTALGLASGLAFALYTVLQRRYRDHDPVGQTVLNSFVAAALTAPWWAWGSGTLPPAKILGGVAVMGAVQLGLPYILFAYGLKAVPAQETSLLMLIEPVLNPLLTALAVGERPGGWTLLGGTIVLGALVYRYVDTSRWRELGWPRGNTGAGS